MGDANMWLQANLGARARWEVHALRFAVRRAIYRRCTMRMTVSEGLGDSGCRLGLEEG